MLLFPKGAGRRTTVSNNGGRQPRWTRAGKELSCVDDGTLMVVPVESGFYLTNHRIAYRDSLLWNLRV